MVALVISLVAFGDWQHPALVLAVFAVVQTLEGTVIQPKIMGQGLKVSPVVIFVGLFLWGFLLGGIGAILAVPLTLLVLMIMENFEGTRMLAVLMRYTGETKKEERQKAAEQAKDLWEKARSTISSKGEAVEEEEKGTF